MATRIRVRAYDIIKRAVEEGVGHGWRAAWKHADKPPNIDEDHARERIEDEVMNALCEVLNFDETGGSE